MKEITERLHQERGYLNDCILRAECGPTKWALPNKYGRPKTFAIGQGLETHFERTLLIRELHKERSELVKSAHFYSMHGLAGEIDAPIQVKIMGKEFSLRYELTYLIESLKQAELLLELEDNWDEEGARPIQQHVLLTSVDFIIANASFILENYFQLLSQPIISPCADGSVDVLWTNEKARILFNIRNSDKRNIHFYGDDYKDDFQLKGSFIADGVVEYLANFLKLFCQ